jgi:hypothetical protein
MTRQIPDVRPSELVEIVRQKIEEKRFVDALLAGKIPPSAYLDEHLVSSVSGGDGG